MNNHPTSDQLTTGEAAEPNTVERTGSRDDPDRLPLEPMDPQLTSIQPGGGFVMLLEQKWGSVRRRWLRKFFPSYIERMAKLRRGDFNPCPHDVLDSRDLKFHTNQGGWHWEKEDDPFAWRDRIPFARVGLAELVLFASCCVLAALLIGWAIIFWKAPLWISIPAWLAVGLLVVSGALVIWFFRDPARNVATGPGQVVAPADGVVVQIERLAHDEFVGGPAVQIGLFLSIFNVHINRVPESCRVIGLTYTPGLFLNALRPESARENERLTVRLQEPTSPYRRIVVRQIAGAIARRIVCWIKPGDLLKRGERFGMIKFGSRTELVIPDEPGLRLRIELRQAVRAGSTVVAEYTE